MSLLKKENFDTQRTLANLQVSFYKMLLLAESCVGSTCLSDREHDDILNAGLAFAHTVKRIEDHRWQITTQDVIQLRWYYEQLHHFVYSRISSGRAKDAWPVCGDDAAHDCTHIAADFDAACDVLARHAISKKGDDAE